MIETSISVAKDAVFAEVQKTTSYVGKKIDEATPLQEGQDSAYDRVRATDTSQELLVRFWNEAATMATERMQRFITNVTNDSSYTAELALTDRWSNHLAPGMQQSLFSFFVSFILSRWFKIANKQESEAYMADATAMIEDVMRKIYYRSAPEREQI